MNELREVGAKEAAMIEGGDWMEKWIDGVVGGLSLGLYGYSKEKGFEYQNSQTGYKNKKGDNDP